MVTKKKAASSSARRNPRERVEPARGSAPRLGAGRRVVRGVLEGIAADGRLLVRWGTGPVRPVSFLETLSYRALLEAVRHRAEVAVAFLDDQPDDPLVLGLLRAEVAHDPDHEDATIERRLEFAAAERIVIRCGDAAVELDATGRVTVRGGDVQVHSTGLTKIKGAKVDIN